MGSLWQEFRYAARVLRKNPGVPAVIVLTLALGIGATTAIFSVVYGVLLRPLPYPDSNRIVAVFEVTSKGRPSRLADPNFDDFRDQSRSFQAIAKYHDDVASVSGAAQPTRTHAGTRLARLSQGLRRSADPRARFQRQRREDRGRSHRSRQPWILEAAARVASETSRSRT